MPLNDTGLNSPDNYLLGQGNLQIALLEADGSPAAFRDVGNASAFTLTSESTEATHDSSRKGTRFTDKRVIVSQTLRVTFNLDEIMDFRNLAMWLSGDASEVTNGAVAGFAEWEMVPEGSIEVLRHYVIKSSVGVRAFSLDSADVTVKTTNVVPVTLTLGTDYTVDSAHGSIFLLDSAAVQLAITNVEGLDVTLAANAGAPATVDQTTAFSRTSYTVAVRFLAENGADDARESEVVLPRVLLSSDGDAPFLGTEFGSIGFTGICENGAVGSLYEGENCIITDVEGNV